MNHYYYYAEHLILDGNELTGSIPQELEDLTKLGMLYILRCTKPIIPETVDGMNFNWTDAKQKLIYSTLSLLQSASPPYILSIYTVTLRLRRNNLENNLSIDFGELDKLGKLIICTVHYKYRSRHLCFFCFVFPSA
jgi:hypothetical protein